MKDGNSTSSSLPELLSASEWRKNIPGFFQLHRKEAQRIGKSLERYGNAANVGSPGGHEQAVNAFKDIDKEIDALIKDAQNGKKMNKLAAGAQSLRGQLDTGRTAINQIDQGIQESRKALLDRIHSGAKDPRGALLEDFLIQPSAADQSPVSSRSSSPAELAATGQARKVAKGEVRLVEIAPQQRLGRERRIEIPRRSSGLGHEQSR